MTVRDTETLLSEAASHAADMERQVDELVAAAKAVLEMLIDENGENHCRETLALSYAIAKATGHALAPKAPERGALLGAMPGLKTQAEIDRAVADGLLALPTLPDDPERGCAAAPKEEAP